MRVLIIGRGPRGRAWEQIVSHQRDCSVVGTVDPDERTGATWRDLGDDALTGVGADAAIVASPPALHAEQAQACFAAGLAVLVEKPLALSVGDAQAIAAAARRAGRPVVVGQNFAHEPLERAIDGALDGLGALRSATIVSARAADATPAHASQLDHPVLWDFAVHHFDLVRRRAGGPPSHVEARHHGTTYDVSFCWASGLEVGWRHDDGGGLFHRSAWWRAAEGAVEVRGASAWRVVPGARPRRLRLPRGAAEARLLSALAQGQSDAEENVGTIAMVAAVQAALERGAVVAVQRGAGERV